MSPGRPSRPPRRDGAASGRPPSRGGGGGGGARPAGGGGGRPASRAGGAGRPPGGRPSGARPSGGRPSSGRPSSTRSSSGRPASGGPRAGGARPGGPRGRRPAAPRQELTAAERRAAEVNAARAPRAPRDPEEERAKIEARTREEWVDEGALRTEASEAASRASAAPRRPRATRPVGPEVSSSIASEARDAKRAAVLTERLAHAQEALDRERFDEARRIALPLLRELSNVAAVHEVLGLTAYRTGKWKQAAAELETAQSLHPSVDLLPVLADVYRALRRWDDVERVWAEIRRVSPSQEVLAEARIVAAGARADQGDLKAALQIMGRSLEVPKRVRDHHLRQWYVLGDLHDRAGNTIEATRYFELVARHDRDFVDVLDRLRSLGR